MSRADLTVANLVALSVGAVAACGSRSDPTLVGHVQALGDSGLSSSSSSGAAAGSSSSSTGSGSSGGGEAGPTAPCQATPGTTITVAAGIATGPNLLVDATRAYWTDDMGSVYAAPLCGGTVTTLASTSGKVWPRALVGDAKSLYWLAGATLLSLDKASGAVRSLAQLPSPTYPDVPIGGIVLAPPGFVMLYVPTLCGPGHLGTSGGPCAETDVATVPIGGGPWTSRAGFTDIGYLVSDGSWAYVADSGYGGGIAGLAPQGGPPFWVGYDRVDWITGFALVGAQLLWSNGSYQAVTLPRPTTPPTMNVLPTPIPGATDVREPYVADVASLYFTNHSSAVLQVALTGGTPTPLVKAGAAGTIHGLAVDATSLYVLGDSDLRRVVLR